MTKPVVKLGQVFVTDGVQKLMSKDDTIIVNIATGASTTYNTMTLVALLDRHRMGDWGELDAHDKRVNDDALSIRGRLLSVYLYNGKRVWIITDDGWEVTTVLLPEEY